MEKILCRIAALEMWEIHQDLCKSKLGVLQIPISQSTAHLDKLSLVHLWTPGIAAISKH